jgi:F-type H+-transporting ATPase subunit a
MANPSEHTAPHNPFAPETLFEHVQDSVEIQVPKFLKPPDGIIKIPQPFVTDPTEATVHGFRITKFMLIELVVALLIAVIFIRLGHKMRRSDAPKGRLWNLFEAILVYLRDQVARPAIGHHDGDRFVPFIWTIFFFVLFCNLFGLLPWAGSPTGALATTAALAVVTFVVVVGAGIKKLGPIKFWTSMVPHLDLPWHMWIPMVLLIFPIEVMGLLIRHFVLAIRLLANMMGGHMVLAVLTSFIIATAGSLAFWGVMPISLMAATGLSLLELFVGVLQAYIFTFLSALFIGMAVHPH